MIFTCKVCGNRQARTFSKEAYHNGTPALSNRHRHSSLRKVPKPSPRRRQPQLLLALPIEWFEDKEVNIEELQKRQGDSVKRVATNEEVFEFMKEANELTANECLHMVV
eukprot:TRINITY_DN9613_c0_g1_i2.p2 TRINITY_DN9613_c0_g1~~TRINITY_DN9613_c0_g1_i2.p2  ORF type:complete len:109 (-),score=7.60 TRINITY_DN9613_c0_g1_i2:90-416(-)